MWVLFIIDEEKDRAGEQRLSIFLGKGIEGKLPFLLSVSMAARNTNQI